MRDHRLGDKESPPDRGVHPGMYRGSALSPLSRDVETIGTALGFECAVIATFCGSDT